VFSSPFKHPFALSIRAADVSKGHRSGSMPLQSPLLLKLPFNVSKQGAIATFGNW
jgi:hypothetical protein